MGEKLKLKKSLVGEDDDPLAPQIRTGASSPRHAKVEAKTKTTTNTNTNTTATTTATTNAHTNANTNTDARKVSDVAANEILYNPFMRMSEDRFDHISKAESRDVQRQRSSPEPGASQATPNTENGTASHSHSHPAQLPSPENVNDGQVDGRNGLGASGKEEKSIGLGVEGDRVVGGKGVVMESGEKLLLHLVSHVAYMSPDRRTIEGSLLLTNYRMEFSPVRTDEVGLWCHYPEEFFRLPVGMIRKISRTSNGQVGRRENSPYLSIVCKDFRVLLFVFEDNSSVNKVLGLIRSVAFPISESSKVSWLFAFDHHGSNGKDVGRTIWHSYNREEEWRRQKVLNDDKWRVCRINHDYKFCPTYPSAFITASGVTDETIALVGQFRSKSRVPIMCWLHSSNGGSIWRCSQPKVGIGNVSVADEKLVAKIRECTPAGHVRIIDCRPFKNAVSNRIKGMGYEDEARYAGTSISFQNIQNIHSVRTSYDKLFQLAKSTSSSNSGSSWLSQVEGTGWLNHIRSILTGAIKLASYVGRQGLAVLVHCSDGWDRTSQVAALGQLLLDPYYRTIKGFRILIEKEWLTVGYKFQSRTGHGKDFTTDSDADQVSPVFLQFIDCTWQLTRVFPTEFEFNETFLISLLDHLYSCQFGTFLYDCDYERKTNELEDKTRSVWEALHPSRQDLKNPFFDPHRRGSPEIVPRSIAIARQVVLWSGYYLRYCPIPSINEHAFVSMQNANKTFRWDPYRRMQDDLSTAHARIKDLEQQIMQLRAASSSPSR